MVGVLVGDEDRIDLGDGRADALECRADRLCALARIDKYLRSVTAYENTVARRARKEGTDIDV